MGSLLEKSLNFNSKITTHSPLVFGGDELMYGGITIPDLEGDYQSITWTLRAN